MPYPRVRRVVGLTAALVALLFGAAGSPAVASGKPGAAIKLYQAAGPTSPVMIDGTHSADITLTDCGCGTTVSTQPFGSAEVRVPAAAGLALTGAFVVDRPQWSVSAGAPLSGWTVYRLVNTGTGTAAAVPPGEAAVLRIPVPASAVAGTYTLQSQVKQANDFSGTGNDFTLSGAQAVLQLGGVVDHLAWSTQPTSIQSSTTTRKADSIVSMCPAPQVRAEDAANHLVSSFTGTVVLTHGAGTFTGLSAPSIAGVATFGSCASGITSSTLGHAYTLTATSGTVTSPASSPFDVLTYLANCGATCTTPVLNGDGTTASAGASGGSDSDPKRITFSVDGDQTWTDPAGQTLPCNPDIGAVSGNALRDVVTVDVQGRSKTVNLQWSKQAVQAAINNGASQWGICLLAAAPFTGGTTPVSDYFGVGHPGYVGRLAACGTAGLLTTDPCIVKLNKGSGGTQLAQVSLPDSPGDPKLF